MVLHYFGTITRNCSLLTPPLWRPALITFGTRRAKIFPNKTGFVFRRLSHDVPTNAAIHHSISVAGRVSGSGVENFRRLANPGKNTVGPEGEVPNERRVRSRVETEAEKEGQRSAKEERGKVSSANFTNKSTRAPIRINTVSAD